jgi:hypothetical protein
MGSPRGFILAGALAAAAVAGLVFLPQNRLLWPSAPVTQSSQSTETPTPSSVRQEASSSATTLPADSIATTEAVPAEPVPNADMTEPAVAAIPAPATPEAITSAVAEQGAEFAASVPAEPVTNAALESATEAASATLEELETTEALSEQARLAEADVVAGANLDATEAVAEAGDADALPGEGEVADGEGTNEDVLAAGAVDAVVADASTAKIAAEGAAAEGADDTLSFAQTEPPVESAETLSGAAASAAETAGATGPLATENQLAPTTTEVYGEVILTILKDTDLEVMQGDSRAGEVLLSRSVRAGEEIRLEPPFSLRTDDAGAIQVSTTIVPNTLDEAYQEREGIKSDPLHIQIDFVLGEDGERQERLFVLKP